MNLTDIDLASIYSQSHRHHLRWFAERRIWLSYRDGRWVDDRDVETNRAAVATSIQLKTAILAELGELEANDEIDGKALSAMRRQSNRQIEHICAFETRRDMIRDAKIAMVVRGDELDANPWILNCKNGVLDLRSKQLREAIPNDLMTKQANVEWLGDEIPANAEWLQVIDRIAGGNTDLALYLQRAFGLALIGEWREKAFWFAYGPTNGGKSTVLEIIRTVLGDYAIAADSSTWMTGHGKGNRGDITRLRGARLVVSSEVGANCAFDEALMKRVTGGDTITAAAKYESEISFAPTFALWLAGNDRPHVASGDEALWKRLRCVPFTSSIPAEKQDAGIAERLLAKESHIILAWMVEGLRLYLKEGLGTCAAVETAREEYRSDANPLADFIEDCLVITKSPRHRVTAKTMNQLYVDWCAKNRPRYPLKRKAFGIALRAMGLRGGRADDIRDENNNRAWQGCQLIRRDDD